MSHSSPSCWVAYHLDECLVCCYASMLPLPDTPFLKAPDFCCLEVVLILQSFQIHRAIILDLEHSQHLERSIFPCCYYSDFACKLKDRARASRFPRLHSLPLVNKRLLVASLRARRRKRAAPSRRACGSVARTRPHRVNVASERLRNAYCRAMAMCQSSSGLMRWSWSFASSPRSILTHSMRPLNVGSPGS